MGLDILSYKVLKENSADKLHLNPKETNKHVFALFEHFSEFVVMDDMEVVNEEFVSDLIGENEITEIECYEGFYVITLDNDREIFMSELDYQNNIFKKVTVKTLYVDMEYLQRKGMKTEFYSEFLSGCWYVADSDNDPEDSPNYVFTNEMLNKVKAYAFDGEPILSLTLKNNQFIRFDY
jgi:hypothetical protein